MPLKSKADIAYEYLKSEIITGRMRPMTNISDEELQKLLGMSRTPVREAILRLKNENFINIAPIKGTFVDPLSLDLLKYLYALRKLNEPYVCYQASLYLEKRAILRLYDDIEKNQKNKSLTLQNFIQEDSNLHWALLKACGNPFLIRAMSIVYDHVDRTRFLIRDPYLDEHFAEHKAILLAMLDEDKEQIEKASLDHAVQSEKRALSLLLER